MMIGLRLLPPSLVLARALGWLVVSGSIVSGMSVSGESAASQCVASVGEWRGPEVVDDDPAKEQDWPLHWNGKQTSYEKLGSDVGEWPRKAILTWAPFAQEAGLELHLSSDLRVLLLMRKKLRAKRFLKLIDETGKRVDEWLPTPERPEPEEEPEEEPEAGGGGELTWSYTYETERPPLESETAVLVQAPDEATYAAALDHAANENEYLGDWIATGKRLTGCILERPLFAAWQENPRGMEEWDIENELVHRLAQLLVLRRFSQVPYWLLTGIAWNVEDDVRGAIYCYPYRNGFVWATEHKGWLKRLKLEMKNVPEPFTMDAFATWKRGTFDGTKALMSFATIQLLRKRVTPEAFASVLEELRLLRDEKARRDNGDGTWTLIPNFEVGTDDQRTAFQRHLPEFEADLEAVFRKGKIK